MNYKYFSRKFGDYYKMSSHQTIIAIVPQMEI